MRYAWNFAHGDGLMWNPGERIQGYTNLLMTVMMSAAALLADKSSAVLAVQATGVLLMLAIAAVTARIADQVLRDAGEDRRQLLTVLSFFCALAYYPLAYWTLMGMETGLLTLLVLLAVWSAFDYVDSRRRARLFVVALSLDGAVLTRMDAVLFAGLIWIFVAYELAVPALRERLKHLVGPLILLAAVVGGLLAFQYWYYGAWLPNTYTLKLTGMPLAARIENGIGFVAPFLLESSLVLAAGIAATILTCRSRTALLMSMVLVAIGYEVYVGGDPWNYWRIMAPAMPLALLLAVIAVSRGITVGMRPRVPGTLTAPALIVAATVTIVLSASVRFLPEISLARKPYLAENNRRTSTSPCCSIR